MDKKLIINQHDLFHSNEGFEIAKKIISNKVYNHHRLLASFVPSVKPKIEMKGRIKSIVHKQSLISVSQNYQQLFLNEANAAKIYWRAVRVN